jgi:Tol biopolymer transport system component
MSLYLPKWWQLSRASCWLVSFVSFLAEFSQLVAVTVAGASLPDKLSGPLEEGESVSIFALSPDGGRVVYRLDQREGFLSRLFSVPVGGGERVRRDATLPEGRDVHSFRITPDGQNVVFRAEDEEGTVGVGRLAMMISRSRPMVRGSFMWRTSRFWV